MRNWNCFCLFAAVALIAGCTTTRSISHSEFRSDGGTDCVPRTGDADPGFEYRGELNEFDVLGIKPWWMERSSVSRRAAMSPTGSW